MADVISEIGIQHEGTVVPGSEKPTCPSCGSDSVNLIDVVIRNDNIMTQGATDPVWRCSCNNIFSGRTASMTRMYHNHSNYTQFGSINDFIDISRRLSELVDELDIDHVSADRLRSFIDQNFQVTGIRPDLDSLITRVDTIEESERERQKDPLEYLRESVAKFQLGD